MEFSPDLVNVASWVSMLLLFVVYAATGGEGVSPLLTLVYFACFALWINTE